MDIGATAAHDNARPVTRESGGGWNLWLHGGPRLAEGGSGRAREHRPRRSVTSAWPSVNGSAIEVRREPRPPSRRVRGDGADLRWDRTPNDGGERMNAVKDEGEAQGEDGLPSSASSEGAS